MALSCLNLQNEDGFIEASRCVWLLFHCVKENNGFLIAFVVRPSLFRGRKKLRPGLESFFSFGLCCTHYIIDIPSLPLNSTFTCWMGRDGFYHLKMRAWGGKSLSSFATQTVFNSITICAAYQRQFNSLLRSVCYFSLWRIGSEWKGEEGLITVQWSRERCTVVLPPVGFPFKSSPFLADLV